MLLIDPKAPFIVITTLLESTLFFNSVPVDQETVSLVTHLVFPAIQGAISLLLNTATIECKSLTRQANSCSNSGQMEMEMGSFLTLMVSLLTRETTKLLLLTVIIIAFKYLMRRVGSFVPLGHLEVATVNLVILAVSWLIHKGITLFPSMATIVCLSSTRKVNS